MYAIIIDVVWKKYKFCWYAVLCTVLYTSGMHNFLKWDSNGWCIQCDIGLDSIWYVQVSVIFHVRVEPTEFLVLYCYFKGTWILHVGECPKHKVKGWSLFVALTDCSEQRLTLFSVNVKIIYAIYDVLGFFHKFGASLPTINIFCTSVYYYLISIDIVFWVVLWKIAVFIDIMIHTLYIFIMQI